MTRAAWRSVCIERSGGYAGLHVRIELRGEALTPAQCAALEGVVRKAAAAVAPPTVRTLHTTPRMPDRFAYRLRLVGLDGSEQTLLLGEDAMPAVLEALARPVI